MMQSSGWKQGSYSAHAVNKQPQVNYNFVIIIAFPSSLLKVRGHGMMHQFSPMLSVSCYCRAFCQSLAGPVYNIVSPSSSLPYSASCAVQSALKNVCSEVPCSDHLATNSLSCYADSDCLGDRDMIHTFSRLT